MAHNEKQKAIDFWSRIKSAHDLLKAVQDYGITYKKLNDDIFGDISIQVIKAVRKHGNKAFKAIRSSPEIWYMYSVGMSNVIVNTTKPKSLK